MRTINPRNNNGSIKLEFTVQGKLYTLAPGGKFADPIAYSNAQRIATQIYNDCITGNFDPTLNKYRPAPIPIPNFKGRTVQAAKEDFEAALEELRTRNLTIEIWDRYVEFKRPSLSPSTIAKDFKKVRNYLIKCPKLKPGDWVEASKFRDWLLTKTTPAATKKILTQVSACCDWAVDEGIIRINSFKDMARKIRLPKSAQSKGPEAFTKEEQERIIDAFKTNKFKAKGDMFGHAHYAPYIEFLFLTGCRPSEAIPLQWKHIAPDFSSIRFVQAFVEGEDGRVLKEGLKTQAERIVYTNDRVAALLQKIKPVRCFPDELVFPAKKGGYIDHHNLCNRQWKRVLAGLKIPYRKPYSTRHSLITNAIEAGLDAKDVSALVGNSPEIIYKHYASAKRNLKLPD